ncbi:hypothetical protein AB3464_03545 [Pseudomonas asplenii]|uniref:Uncharacterized protein n=1 Tax=Pseudomonas asplenii TaxID=53407 RepID=A0A1H6NX90_9PSED|nr:MULTISPECIES: hypothetical protein [Pseudomonas]UZE26946.1 hypothetical protein LOY63_16265 [Pseudomonas asplenii]SEI21573.1 hypothetical protein SAMN05216581_4543 [Pseudomonas fuscovaginae]
MADNDYELYERFHTPDPRIAERERVAMSPEEKAWALYKGSLHRSGWLEWLILPVVIGLWAPMVCIVLVLLAYQALFAPEFDPQRHGEAIFTAMLLSTLLLFVVWVAWNRHRALHDPRLLYWRDLPEVAEVELERHTLVSAFSLWSSDYDPDNPQVARWVDGRIQQMADSGVSQWLLARTAEGRWLVLCERVAGTFRGYGTQVRPAAASQWPLSRELAIAFAPRTNVPLGLRFSGAPLALAETSHWLSRGDLDRLTRVAHHWTFFAPERYGLINSAYVPWLEELLGRVQPGVADSTLPVC